VKSFLVVLGVLLIVGSSNQLASAEPSQMLQHHIFEPNQGLEQELDDNDHKSELRRTEAILIYICHNDFIKKLVAMVREKIDNGSCRIGGGINSKGIV
jgi:hypothetical protein